MLTNAGISNTDNSSKFFFHHNVIRLDIKDNKIFLVLQKFYEKNKPELKPIPVNISLHSPLVRFKYNDSLNYLQFSEIGFKQLRLPEFKAIYLDPNITSFRNELTEKKSYEFFSLTYELPTDPLLAVNMIALFDNFISNGCASFSDIPVVNCINQQGNFTDSLSSLFFNEVVAAIGDESEMPNCEGKKFDYRANHPLIKKIIQLDESIIQDAYQPIIRQIKDLFNFCALENLSFIDCLENPILKKICLTNKNPYFLIDTEVDENNKFSIMQEIKEHLLSGNNANIWKKILNNVMEAAVYNLYSPCLGKESHEGGDFNSHYTEVQFLKHMMSNLKFFNDQFSFIDLVDNEAYCQYYAPGRKNHDIFELELRVFEKYTALKFEDCNFHQTIILKPESNQILKTMGFHHLIELKQLLKNLEKPLSNNLNSTFFGTLTNIGTFLANAFSNNRIAGYKFRK